jgi:hypothetical protein
MNSSQTGKDPTERTVPVPLITLIPIVPESKREKTAEALLNALQGKIANPNTRSAYETAWREFFVFCSEFKLELDLIKPFHFGLWQKWQEAGVKDKRNTFATKPHGVATQRQHLAAIRLLFDHLPGGRLGQSQPSGACFSASP